MEKKQP